MFDTRSRRVRVLGERTFTPGAANVLWDGRDDRGRPVSPGVYYLAVRSGLELWTKKAVVLR